MSGVTPDQLIAFGDKRPVVGKGVFIASGARVVGDVTLGDGVSVWFNAVLRGDIHRVVIGPGTNLQDNSVCHVADDLACIVGACCTVGHHAVLHACTIGNETLIGMGAVVMDGCVIGNQCIIGASALLTKGLKIPDGSLVYGAPAKVVSQLGETERRQLRAMAEKYCQIARAYLDAAATCRNAS
ncbi:MAG: gamma carbonic anhydrase family protein [Verrucomicrobia bacterium]|nr:gamma carbonic anhydrase family protein [Verrucomicrobiota bacterium]